MADAVIRQTLSERTDARIREVLTGRRRGIRSAFLFAGPAVVASVAYVDPGNFATNIQAGSGYGYGLLWVVLAANLIAMLFQALSAKLGIVTGRNLAEMCRDRFPAPVSYAIWTASEVAAMATDLAEFLGGAIGLALLFHMAPLCGMAVTAIVSYAILLLGGRGFRPLELIIGSLVAVIGLCYVIEMFIAPVAWKQAALGTLLPSMPDATALTISVGILGATVMPHALYLHSGLTQQRTPARNDRDRRQLVRFSNQECIVALSIAGAVNMAIVIMAATAFHAGHPTVAEIESAYHTLTPLLGGAAAGVFLVSLMASGISSSAVGILAGQIIMQGFVGFRIPMFVRRLLTILPAFAVGLAGGNITQALIYSQVVLSFVLPIPMIALIIFTRNPEIMGKFSNGRLTSTAAIAGMGIILCLNAVLLLQTFGIPVSSLYGR